MIISVGFDLDGTLLNTDKRHKLVLRDIAAEYNIELSNDELDNYLSLKKNGLSGLQVLTDMQLVHASDIHQEWIKRIEFEEYLSLDSLYDDAINTLETLSLNKQCSLYLVSLRNRPANAIKQVEKLGLSRFFKKIYFEKHKELKGHCKSFVGDVAYNWIVGDSEIDYIWAKNKSAKFYALGRGSRSETYWNAIGVNSFRNLDLLIPMINCS